MTDFVKKIYHMPGTKLTPEVVLARTLEKTPRIKAVAVMIIWDDDSVDSDWSLMSASEFCFMVARLEMERNLMLMTAPVPAETSPERPA